MRCAAVRCRTRRCGRRCTSPRQPMSPAARPCAAHDRLPARSAVSQGRLVQRHVQDPHPRSDLQRRYARRRDTEAGMVEIDAVLHPEAAELIWTNSSTLRPSSRASPGRCRPGLLECHCLPDQRFRGIARGRGCARGGVLTEHPAHHEVDVRGSSSRRCCRMRSMEARCNVAMTRSPRIPRSVRSSSGATSSGYPQRYGPMLSAVMVMPSGVDPAQP